MDYSVKSCPWGDCPHINHGPISREHEGRFTKQSKAESSMMKSTSSIVIAGANARNHAK